jgi:hypothetical protein
MSKVITMPKIQLGKTVATRGIARHIQARPSDVPPIAAAILRHQRGDWGEVSPEDAMQNDFAAGAGECIVSAYTLPCGERIWIVTEADRRMTTIQFASELEQSAPA